jgi:hyaluronan synthase
MSYRHRRPTLLARVVRLATRRSAVAGASTRVRPVRRGHSPIVSVAVFAVLAIAALWQLNAITTSSAYGLAAFTILAGKLLASIRHRPVTTGDGFTVDVTPRLAVIVPFYNEDPALLTACLRSILAQTCLPASLHIIDDGSADPAARLAVEALLPQLRRRIAKVSCTLFPENRGKREALAVGIRAADDVEVVVTIDSDTVLDPAAFAEGVRPFTDPDVAAVTGLVRALNHDRNLLTRVVDLRYANAFLYERAAYSLAGAVLCCCGSLSLWRANVVRAYVNDFVSQRFLGRPATFGDDRRLTNYALKHGKVVLQDTALAYTAVPERFSHFVRQQVRWNKSFFRESLWAIQHLPVRSPAFPLALLELTSWATFSLMLGFAVLVRPFTTGGSILAAYLLYLAVMSYARSVRYLEVRHTGQNGRRHASVFLLAPLYGLLHIVLLVPLRFYSLATLRGGAWGTRKSGVEVAVEPVATG